MNIVAVADVLNFLIALVTVIIITKLVLRTEKCLDTAAKLFLVASLILLVASLLELNKYAGIVSVDAAMGLFHLSRTFALLFFASGGYFLLKMASGKCQ